MAGRFPAKNGENGERKRGTDRHRGPWINASRKRLRITAEEELEAKLGFDLFTEGDKRLGWLLTLASSSWEDRHTRKTYSCVDLYFVTQDGSTFKAKHRFSPYFYASTKDNVEREVEEYLCRRYEGRISSIEIVDKEDLDLKNHLSGLCKTYLKISFENVQQLMHVKSDLLHVVARNQARSDAADAYELIFNGYSNNKPQDYIDCIVDLREYDVPYHVRFAIDNDVRCGQWYDVSMSGCAVVLEKRMDLLQRAEVCVCAFDIETTKLPLKFPDADYDQVMMISYMVDGQGYLIINRECVGEDIEDVEYTPKPEFEGCFKVKNVKNEEELLQQWFKHMKEVKPGIYVTYNGDFFDWPFVEKRAAHYGIMMNEELGFKYDSNQGECRSKFSCHLDCFAWVKRDSYLPQGSQGLKAVTKAKLGYDPLEVNPEDMVRLAMEHPQMMASYSVSDAVATYYLYTLYVHPFIFSLATIIPMPPDEVLRKGSGTLCEMLLMVQAFKANVICPNKHLDDCEKFYKNHLLESETYIGGHVECLESGVFRSDLPTRFQLDPSAFDQLIKNLDRDLQYAIVTEGKMDIDSISNYEEVKHEIMTKLMALRDHPTLEERPLIYHLDVAAMYPNIILTNRLQPPAIVSDEICTACDFNRPGKNCLRKLDWVWRGEISMAKRSDYYHLKKQLESEVVDDKDGQPSKIFLNLSRHEQHLKLKERLRKYCQKAYKRVLDKPITEVRQAEICMRENSFYIDTVRSFRDRRYEYKGLNKAWKGKLADAKTSGNPLKIQEAQDMVVLYDSLQLAHKCILNSFYGYVMRKGARWYSMEMAGVVTYTGAKIIQNARLLIEKIGRPLELDTDGIWCALPGSFPENFTYHTRDSKRRHVISYPCVMLNVDVAINNTNDQYQTLDDPSTKTYGTHSECSIEFEVDGPYKAMILPASKEEGILIKKRYAVFNEDGTLAELKGFEIKRRGELKLIKVFQAEVFDKFLHGRTLLECYSAVASVANGWLDLLDNEGIDIADSELLDYISESSTMSKSLSDYGERKSCAVTTARRLSDFLGDAMVKDKGLRCQYIVASEPQGTPVSERAVPVAIFETESEIMKYYVKKWCKISSDVGIRSIIDWSYYKQRLSSAIQKIITIPAAMQKISNPVPRVTHPDWLHKKVCEKENRFRQKKLLDIFSSASKETAREMDMEDFLTKEKSGTSQPKPIGCFQKKVFYSHQKDISSRIQQPIVVNHNVMEIINKDIDYKEWLHIKKRRWKEARQERKKHRLGNVKMGHQSVAVANYQSHPFGKKLDHNTSGIGSFFRRQGSALFRSHWQIIQLLPSGQLGLFSAWVIADGIMLKISIDIPRVFYLNSRASVTEEFPGRHVNKILPHNRPCFNLIEVITDEGEFKVESRKLANHLADPEVEGIYETKVPLDYNAILQIGCVCKVDETEKFQTIKDKWSLRELHMKTTAECSYLEAISYIYLYHSSCDGRGMHLAYFPASKALWVIVISPSQNKELSSSSLEKQFQKACQTSSVDSLTASHITCKVDYVKSFGLAERLLQRVLVEYRGQHAGPTICLVEWPKFHELKSSIHILNDFPCISIPCKSHDNNYKILGWQSAAGEIGIRRCAASSHWLNERILLSRYAHVPLGNFEHDWFLFTIDVFFSRALRDQQQILWISDDGVPNLGGINDDDVSFFDETPTHLVNKIKIDNPAVTYPGAYRSITVEFKIQYLAVNALLKSSQLNEMEGGSSVALETNVNSSDVENEIGLPAFRVLRQLIGRCIADAVTSGNVFADAILQHLYRWLCSPMSKLHDPALHRALHKVMKKLFGLLLKEIRKLGGGIVFASFSKILIDTGKSDLPSAKTYCECLLKALQSRDLFEWIEIEPFQFWHSLLFMDQFNYGGIPEKSTPISPDGSTVQNKDIDDKPAILSSWNIAEYLPEEIQEDFILIISEFLYIPWKSLQQADTRSSRDNCTPSITISAAESLEGSMTELLKNQISNYFTERLLKIVRRMLNHVNEHAKSVGEKHSSLKSPASSPHTVDAALDFIKHVCAVLALDQRVQQDILRMRKNLLKLVHVKEFAPEAQFNGPCHSLTLPNVICSFCNECRDLDLCRDLWLPEQNLHCAMSHCGQSYDREQIENALFQIVRQRERLYHLQDVECVRCREVKVSHLAEQCGCGGSFRCTEDVSDFSGKMQIFLRVADKHKFHILSECVQWILELSKQW